MIGKEEYGQNPFFTQEIKYQNKTYFIKTDIDKMKRFPRLVRNIFL